MEGVVGFDKLSSWVSLYSPPTNSKGNQDPSLIVVCPWLGAKPKHIANYTAGYQELFPSASILVVQTWTYDVILRQTDGGHFARLEPARDVLLRYIDANAGIRVMHMFSNGGALAAGLLLAMIRSSRPDLGGHAFQALALDSCPGQGDYLEIARVPVVSLGFHTSPWPIYATASLLAHIGASFYLIGNALGIPNTIERIRRRLNDEALVELSVPRLYLYSKADELVAWKDVVSHILEAKEKGYEVDKVEFQDSRHCTHPQEDAAKYWNAVSGFVRKGGVVRAKL